MRDPMAKRTQATDDELSAEDAAKAFGITVGTLHNWVRRGGLQASSKSGSRSFYRRSDVQAYVDARNNRSTSRSVGAGQQPASSSEDPEAEFDAEIKAATPSHQEVLGELYSVADLKALSGDDLKDALTRAKALREIYAAKAARLRADQQEGLLVEAIDVRSLCTGFFAVIKAKMESLPTDLADRLSLSATPEAIERDLRDWARIALGDMKAELGGFQ